MLESGGDNPFEDERRQFLVQQMVNISDEDSSTAPCPHRYLSRDELEQRLYSSVKVFENYVGRRVKKTFGDGVEHHGTIRCGRKDEAGGDLLTVQFSTY